MKADFKVFIDACVLANFGVCDLLLRLAERPRLFLPMWSEEVLDETYRTQVSKLGWPREYADSFQREVNKAFPNASVNDYEHIIPVLENDDKDKHVLAGAIRSGCSLILTFNLKDFPEEALSPWGVEVSHPQDYLLVLYEMEAMQVASRLAAIAARRNIDQTDLLLRLGKTLPQFASRLIDDLNLS